MSAARRTRADDRIAQGAGSVLSLSAAARLLPGPDTAVRGWLRAEGLATAAPWGGGEIVVWAAVLARLSPPGVAEPATLDGSSGRRAIRLPLASL